jgi:hypothetical protein
MSVRLLPHPACSARNPGRIPCLCPALSSSAPADPFATKTYLGTDVGHDRALLGSFGLLSHVVSQRLMPVESVFLFVSSGKQDRPSACRCIRMPVVTGQPRTATLRCNSRIIPFGRTSPSSQSAYIIQVLALPCLFSDRRTTHSHFQLRYIHQSCPFPPHGTGKSAELTSDCSGAACTCSRSPSRTSVHPLILIDHYNL